MLSWLNRKWTGALCAGLAVAFLVIGWQPFAPMPRNRVSWLHDGPGLRFELNGVAAEPAASAPVRGSSPAALPGFSIELWLEAADEPHDDVHHIVTIHDGGLPSRLVLCQWRSELLLRSPQPRDARGFWERGVPVLHAHQRRLITITSDSSGTTFYVDGAVAAQFPRFVLPSDSLDGRLILGDAATGKHAWAGALHGLALHDRALPPDEALARQAAWKTFDTPTLKKAPAPTALYLFDDRTGDTIADHSPNRRHIHVASRYVVPHRRLLELPRASLRQNRPLLGDAILNLCGFVPVGFLVFRFRRLGPAPRSSWRDVSAAALAGGLLSLTIETVQCWLPDRTSSATDLFLNTSGALAGAVLALWLHRAKRKQAPEISSGAQENG